jgi:hypothetical protein
MSNLLVYGMTPWCRPERNPWPSDHGIVKICFFWRWPCVRTFTVGVMALRVAGLMTLRMSYETTIKTLKIGFEMIWSPPASSALTCHSELCHNGTLNKRLLNSSRHLQDRKMALAVSCFLVYLSFPQLSTVPRPSEGRGGAVTLDWYA